MSTQVEIMKKLCNAIKDRDLNTVNECLQDRTTPPLHLWIDEQDFFTPWHWAHSYGTYKIVKALLDAGADPNIKLDYLGYETVLFGAVSRDEPAIVHLLVQHGADINAVDKDGRTPLHCAIRRSSEKKDMIMTLLTLEADITKGNDIVEWMERDCPEYDDYFYDAYDEFLNQIEAKNPRFYQVNIDRLKKLLEKHKDLPEYLKKKVKEEMIAEESNKFKGKSTDSQDDLTRSASPPNASKTSF